MKRVAIAVALFVAGLLSLAQAQSPQVRHLLLGKGAAGAVAAPVTIFTTTFLNDDAWATYTLRLTEVITSGAQTNVRVTLTASAALGALTCSHVAIGVGVNSTSGDTTATPTELKFYGASGCGTIAQGSSSVSDWTAFSGFTSSDFLVVIVDIDASGGTQDTAGTVGSTRYKVATQSWNVQTVSASGYGGPLGGTTALAKIETQ